MKVERYKNDINKKVKWTVYKLYDSNREGRWIVLALRQGLIGRVKP
jgi:hypothetical protein